MDGPGMESQFGGRFFSPVHSDPGSKASSYKMGKVYFPGVERPGIGVDHTTIRSAEVIEIVEL